MKNRIEDVTIKFLLFMRIEVGAHPPMPYPELEEEDEDETGPRAIEPSPAEKARSEMQQREAQQSVIDLTRNIQRNEDDELAQLQCSGNGAGHQAPQPRATAKVGRNEMCPCGSGKKYKKCHGAAA